MRKLLLMVVLTTIAATAAAQVADREITIDGGRAPLHGSLMTAGSPRPGPAVLFISGSGPTDRNGNSNLPQVRPATIKLLAQGLAEQGISSLRFDKRGIGDSAPAMAAEADLRFGTYVDDAVAWARFLAHQPSVQCVVVVGHSEGALVGTLAAKRVPACGLVTLAGAGRPAKTVVAEQLARLPEPSRGAALSALAELAAGRTVADPGIPALFRPSVQPYLTSWLSIDPAKELAGYAGPVSIIQGMTDLQVSAEDARALAAAHPGAALLLLDGVNHVLKAAPADPAVNFATYADPNLPLDPRVTAAVIDLVAKARR